MRNKNTKRAVCKLYIDGEDISGGGFIIGANSFVDIERPVNVDRKFKFVSLESEEAYDHGKNGSNHDKKKGTIVAEFALEKEFKLPAWTYIHTCPPYLPYVHPYNYPYGTWISTNPNSVVDYQATYCQNPSLLSSKGISQATYDCNPCDVGSVNLNNFSAGAVNLCGMGGMGLAPDLQDGATVEGSKSDQSFYQVSFQAEDTWTTLRLFLQGYEAPTKDATTYEVSFYNQSGAPVRIEASDKDRKSLNDLEMEVQKLRLMKEIAQLKKELL